MSFKGKTYGRNGYQRQPKRERSENAFDILKIRLPKSMNMILKAKSEQLNLPVAKLIGISIDNELAQLDESFEYDTDFLKLPYAQGAYLNEAGMIYRWLRDMVDYGIGLDHLIMCRRDIGIMDRNTFLLAFREAIEEKRIESFYPEQGKFRYRLEYRYWRACDPEKPNYGTTRSKRPTGEFVEDDE